MKNAVRLAALGVLIAAAAWLWTVLFPAPEKIIRQRLDDVVRAVSFDANESPLVALGKAQKLASLVGTNIEVSLDMPGGSARTFTGREEIVQAAAGARSAGGALKVEFLDIEISVAADRQSAIVTLTVKAEVAGNQDFGLEPMKLTFQKTDGEWLITRAESVRSLT